MAKKEQKVYMPLMIGDWLKGTRGMKAQVRGVYINLLLYQWDNGFIPADMETLSLIDPEVGSVWVAIKNKFEEFEPGKLRNLKNDEVKAFWSKQRKNGEKGGHKKISNPNVPPTHNPETNPNRGLHIDPDLDIELNIKGADFQNYQKWTDQILDDNDPGFQSMFMNEGLTISAENFTHLVRDHLDLLGRYPNMKPPDQQRFRGSCMKHIRENYKKLNVKNGTHKNSNTEHIASLAASRRSKST